MIRLVKFTVKKEESYILESVLSIMIEIEEKFSNLILVSEIFVVRFVLIVKMVRSSFYWEIMFEN